jgi:5-amino-6-(5-phosphoribosylamino)uracil reductase
VRQLLPAHADDVEDLWDLYALPDAPHVRAGFVLSVDGAIAVGGSSRPLSGAADRAALRTLRAVSDVVLVGAGTAREEDYGRVPLPEPLRRRRLEAGRAERPALAVATRSGDLDPASRLLADPEQRVLVLTAGPVPEDLPDHVEVVVADGARAVVAALHDRGLRRVHCEGGPELLSALLADDVVDELCLTTSPQLVGGGPGLLTTPAPAALRLLSLLEDDGTLLARWSLRG